MRDFGASESQRDVTNMWAVLASYAIQWNPSGHPPLRGLLSPFRNGWTGSVNA